MVKAVIFDLDGVICDTASLHYKAWRKIANSLGGDITEEFNELLKGVDRSNSLRLILEYINVKENDVDFEKILIEKNNYYVSLLDTLGPESILPSIETLFNEIKAYGLKIAIASSSKNATLILKKIGLYNQVDVIANPEEVVNGKPAPDIFLLAAKAVNVNPGECIGIEDSQVGIDALNDANIKSIAIGQNLKNASLTLCDTKKLCLNTILNI